MPNKVDLLGGILGPQVDIQNIHCMLNFAKRTVN